MDATVPSPADDENVELEEVPQENSRQQLSDTYIRFNPKNSTGFTTKGHVIEVQIPRTEHVIALGKAYIMLDLNLAFTSFSSVETSGSVTTEPDDYYEEYGNFYVGMINAATIFDQLRISNNGKTIYTDTFAQVNSRIWQMTKSSHYLKSMPASFLNLDDITMNEGFIVQKLTAAKFSDDGDTHEFTFKLQIPLPCLFNCFDNANNFSTSDLTDEITLSMQLSFVNKYLCLIEADDNGRVIDIQPFDKNGYAYYYSSNHNASNGNQTRYAVRAIEYRSADLYYIKDNLSIVCPAHYPTETEANAMSGLVDNQGVDYPFVHCDIHAQTIDFGPCTDNNTGSDANGNTPNVWAKTETQALNYNTNVKNIFAVLMLASHHTSNVVYDKPFISNIETNLSELIKLANNKVHTGKTYTGDNDMYKDLINAFGTDGFKNLERFDDAIKHDYFQHDPTSKKMLGSYMQYYPVACGQMLGVSSDYFAHQINYKFKSEYQGEVKHATNDASVTWMNTTAGSQNYANSTVYCCVLTFKRLLFVNGGLDIENPLSDTYDIRRHLRGEAVGNAHGIVGSLFEPVTNLLTSAGGAIRDEIYRIKRNKNTTHAYTRLGKDGYNRHKDIIEANGTMGHRKFKKFIDNLMETEQQLTQTHGLGRDPNALGGSSVLTIGQANQEIETEKGVDIRNLNLNVYHKQSKNADFADRVGWKHQLILDYKFHGNSRKLRLGSWGTETAIVAANNSHGLGTWLKDKWQRVKNWWHDKGKGWAKDQGQQLLNNAKDIAKQYAARILSGEIPLSSIPQKFLPEVQNILKSGDLTKGMDPKIQQAVDTVKKIKNGEMTWSDVPVEVYNLIKSKNLESSATGNGLLVRHGFYAGINPHPTASWGVTKRRIEMLLDKNPATLKDRDLKDIYMYKRVKSGHPLVDKHGTLGVTLKKLYGEPIYRRKLMTENRVHGIPKPLAPHEDIAPVNSPLMEQVDVNHGISMFTATSSGEKKNKKRYGAYASSPAKEFTDEEFEKLWKKTKAKLKEKMKKKLHDKYGSK